MNFYDLIEIYASLHGMDNNDVLHLWCRGSIDATSLLAAWLEDEGIFDYADSLITVIRVLGSQAKRDHNENPWEVPD